MARASEKLDPSRAPATVPGRRAGDRGDPAAPRDSARAGHGPVAGAGHSPAADRTRCSTRVLGHKSGRCRTARCSTGNPGSGMASPRPPQAGDPPCHPLDSRGDRRHTRVVEHVSTCQTPRARRCNLRALTSFRDHAGPTTLPHHPPEGNRARQDFPSTMNTTVSPAAFTPPAAPVQSPTPVRNMLDQGQWLPGWVRSREQRRVHSR